MSYSLTMSQFAEGEAEFRKALELDPSDATAAIVSFLENLSFRLS